MKNNRGSRTLAIIALIVAVAGISVAFAALSQNLEITANGTIKKSDWDIHWSAATGAKIVGGTNVSFGTVTPALATEPKAITISDIVLEKPGDKVEWTITATNAGDIDAVLTTFTDIFAKTVTIDPADTLLTAAHVIVTLTKADDTAIAVGNELLAGASQAYKLTIEFDPLATALPTVPVVIQITSLFPWGQK